jgi:hypothetical protein
MQDKGHYPKTAFPLMAQSFLIRERKHLPSNAEIKYVPDTMAAKKWKPSPNYILRSQISLLT